MAPLRTFLVMVMVAALHPGCTRSLGALLDADAGTPPDDGSYPAAADPCDHLVGDQRQSAWPMFQRCASHAGLSPNRGPTTATLRWTVPCVTTLEGFVVDSDGRLVGCADTLEAVAARHPVDGSILWTAPLPADDVLFTGYPSLGADGELYVGTLNGLLSLTREGVERWYLRGHYHLDPGPVKGSLMVGPDRLVYAFLGQYDSTLRLVDPEGNTALTVAATDFGVHHLALEGYPALSREGLLVVRGANNIGSVYGRLLTRNASGLLDQRFEQADRLIGQPVLDAAGTTYVILHPTEADEAGELVAIAPDGAIRWRSPGANRTWIMPALGPDGTVLVVTDAAPAGLRAMGPDGRLRWEQPLPAAVTAHPVVDGDGAIFLGLEGQVVALGAEGTTGWTLPVPGQTSLALAIGDDETLYVQTDSALLAVGP